MFRSSKVELQAKSVRNEYTSVFSTILVYDILTSCFGDHLFFWILFIPYFHVLLFLHIDFCFSYYYPSWTRWFIIFQRLTNECILFCIKTIYDTMWFQKKFMYSIRDKCFFSVRTNSRVKVFGIVCLYRTWIIFFCSVCNKSSFYAIEGTEKAH